ncbi:hypothetical protein [Streptosporangium nondiastaticum]|uniref:hypothetical protein n=1 Tax=Streptosporangium nondiastaticum TaxID=35764 RepID=UPI001672AFD6|nr:hypothetical protein [Streptosporangium nondiastaticum]
MGKARLAAVRLSRGDTAAALELFAEPLTPEEPEGLTAAFLRCGMELVDAGEI